MIKLAINQIRTVTTFRYFEFSKCVIVTQPKLATRYLEDVFKKSNGISFGELRLSSENKILIESVNGVDPSKFTDKKQNKKELIFLIRKPEEKLYSGLVQSLFLEDTSPHGTRQQLQKSFSLIKQKPYQYTFDIIDRYNQITGYCRTNPTDFFEYNQNEKLLTGLEIDYLFEYFEFKFDLISHILHYDAHLAPTSANTLKLLNELEHQELVDLNKLKIIDISTFDSNAKYFKALNMNITGTVSSGQSNKGLYCLVDKFFNRIGTNTELKHFWVQYNYFEQILYNQILLNHTDDNEIRN